MGALRFILAAMVLVSHMGVTIRGLHPGVIAVIIFYLLAGQVVVGLLLKWQHEPDLYARFYRDRAWRIAPQYLMAMLLGAVMWLLGVESYYLEKSPSLADWLANLTVMPLNFFMFTGQDRFSLVPPAWSLGAELQFYLFAPFLVLLRRRLLGALVASLAVFIAAQVQLLNTDHFGYRLLPGILFIFLLGGMLSPYHGPESRAGYRRLAWLLWSLLAGYCVWLMTWGPPLPFNREVAIGIAAGVPLLVVLQGSLQPHRPITERCHRIFGALSYGLFLFHFPAMWLIGNPGGVGTRTEIVQVFAISVALAAFGHWCVEQPLWRRFRQFGATPQKRTPLVSAKQ